MKTLLIATGVLGILAASAGAQDNLSQKKKELDEVQAKIGYAISNAKVIGLEAGIMGPAVKGAPYSADEIHELTQVLADGTRIHNETKTTVYRDSEGRVRREGNGEVSIFDNTSGTSYMMNTGNQSVQKMQMAMNLMTYTTKKTVTTNSATSATATVTTTGDAQMEPGAVRTFQFNSPGGPISNRIYLTGKGLAEAGKKETLGTQIMEGVSAEGTRFTSTIEVGAIGNDRPILTTEERWYSSDLQVNMLTKRSDPRNGEEVTKLTNVRRIEPDPSLFQVPANYHIAK